MRQGSLRRIQEKPNARRPLRCAVNNASFGSRSGFDRLVVVGGELARTGDWRKGSLSESARFPAAQKPHYGFIWVYRI